MSDPDTMRTLEAFQVVFDGPPGPEGGRFVEVEDAKGRSVNVGEWVERGDGTWALNITIAPQSAAPVPPPNVAFRFAIVNGKRVEFDDLKVGDEFRLFGLQAVEVSGGLRRVTRAPVPRDGDEAWNSDLECEFVKPDTSVADKKRADMLGFEPRTTAERLAWLGESLPPADELVEAGIDATRPGPGLVSSERPATLVREVDNDGEPVTEPGDDDQPYVIQELTLPPDEFTVTAETLAQWERIPTAPSPPEWTTWNYSDFAIRWRSESYCVDFEVAEVYDLGSGDLSERKAPCSMPCEGWPEVSYITGHVKFDGCVNWNKCDDVMFHECGPDADPLIGRALRAVYQIGRHVFAERHPDLWDREQSLASERLMARVERVGDGWACHGPAGFSEGCGANRQEAIDDFDAKNGPAVLS